MKTAKVGRGLRTRREPKPKPTLPTKSVAAFEEEYANSTEGQNRHSAMARVYEHLEANKRQTRLVIPTKTVKFGIFGDTHFGSLYEDLDALNAYADACRAAKVQCMIHAGDVLEGYKLYRGQEFETHKHGWEAQSTWFKEVAPDFGVPVYFITGNHDVAFKRAAGITVGKGLQELRPDWHFIGEDYGTVNLRANGHDFKVGVLHPGGGSSYALSYRPQKIVEQIEGGQKPDILAIGNYHKSDWIPSYRNVSVLQVGCFQRQTPFMLTKGLAAMVGGWIMEYAPGEGCSRQKAEFFPFY
jgi:predicted phosphodiesterase